MDAKRLTEWFASSEGLSKSFAGLLAAVLAVWAAYDKAIATFVEPLGIQSWIPKVGAALVIAVLLWLLIRSFRSFARASRLERPDAFSLKPTGPDTLIGRADDLATLVNSVKQNRVVLLDGESGCGKSALVSAGLVPVLKDGAVLLPVALRDWGDDWERGPLAASLDALFHGLSQANLEKMSWNSAPDLGGKSADLAVDLDTRLKSVFETLGRRPLLIADQFDDYQARHRSRFLDVEGNWLSAASIAKANQFWALVSARLALGQMHMMVITRADMAAGLSCVRFLGDDQTATRTLARVDTEYLQPLLTGIAVEGEKPPVVSNPDQGWNELIQIVERDLKLEGSILMQQVRTVLLGLRQFSMLTPKHYRSVGGLRGVETLVVTRAVRRASSGSQDSLRVVRAVLNELTLSATSSQVPKARRALLPHLESVVGDRAQTAAILGSLQQDQVVRPADTGNGLTAWQLDHDYLARAVLAEARQAGRWELALRDGKTRYDQSAGNWRLRWTAMLPWRTLVRVCWERLRNRLRFHDTATYVQISAIKPLIVALTVGSISWAMLGWNEERLLANEAAAIISKFGGSSQNGAVLQVWRAPEPLRDQVYKILLEDAHKDGSRIERAALTKWPLAHAALDPIRRIQALKVLRARLESEKDFRLASAFANAYSAVAATLNDQAALKSETLALRARLESEKYSFIASAFAHAYSAVAARLTDQAELKSVSSALRARLESANDSFNASAFAQAYSTVAARLTDQAELKSASLALRARLESEKDSFNASAFAHAYSAVAARLTDQAALKSETLALRARLESEKDSFNASAFANAYSAVAAPLTDQAELKSETLALRARLESEKDFRLASAFANAYSAVAARLTDQAELKSASLALRARLESEKDSFNASAFAHAYSAVAARLTDQAALKSETLALRARLESEKDSFNASAFANAYSAVAARLTDQAELKSETLALRARLESEKDSDIASAFANAYSAVAARLTDQAELKSASLALRARLESEKDSFNASAFAHAYSAVAARLTDQAALKSETLALRARLESEKDSRRSSAFAQAYSAVAARLTDQAALKSETLALRVRLESEKDSDIASDFAHAYSAVTGAFIVRDTPGRKALVIEILTMAAHPLLTDATPLLAALKRLALVDFEGDLGAAVLSAVKTYGIRPEQLRPLPITAPH